MKISGINFSEKTVENIEVNGDNIKEFKFEFNDNTFKITVMNNDEEVFEEFEEETIAKEVIAEPSEKVIEEPVNKKLTIDDVKNIIDENIP